MDELISLLLIVALLLASVLIVELVRIVVERTEQQDD